MIRSLSARIFFAAAALALQTSVAASSLTGTVVNNTSETPVIELEVGLVIHTPDTAVTLNTHTVDEGSFAFDISEFPEAAQLFLTAHFDHVDYVQPVDPSATTAVDFAVYNRSQSDSAISVSSHHVILDSNAREIIHVLIAGNSSTYTYLGGEGHGHGLEVTYSEGADELVSGAEGMHAHGRTLIDPRPVKPGTSQLMYTLRMPDSGHFEQIVDYPTETVDVMVLPADADVSATTLQDLGPVTFGGRTFRRLTASNLIPGERFSLTLGSTTEWVLWSKSGPFAWVIGGAGLAIILLVYWFWPWKRSAQTAGGGAGIEARRDALVEAIADLDDRLEDGELSEDDHRIRREALKDELIRLSREIGV